MDVPFVDLKAQASQLHEELTAAFQSVVDHAAYTLGPDLQEFEEAFAAFCGVKHCVGVSSGTDAMKLALLGAGVGPGDEVVVPANTFIATAEAVSHIGATPVFCDCAADTALMDPEALRQVCEQRAGKLKAVVPVHLYGQPCQMDQILQVATERGLAVVEDACQAHGGLYKGRPCGSFGVTAAFSFYPGKNLGALGDGGAVVTSYPEIAERLRLLRNHGQAQKQVHTLVGYCDRLHNLQAAFLSVKLRRLASWNAARREAAARYDALLADVPSVEHIAVAAHVQPVYHLYAVRVLGTPRDDVREQLAVAGVQSGIHYAVPLHLQPAYEYLGYRRGAFPRAEGLAAHIVSLPMFPEITARQQEHVAAVLAAAVGS